MKPLFWFPVPVRAAQSQRNRVLAERLFVRVKVLVRRFAEWVYGCYAWGVFILLVLSCGGLVMLLRTPSRGRPVVRFAARMSFRLARMPVSVTGLDHLPAEPHILLVNHTSFLDAIALTALLPPRPGYAFIARQQFASQRIFCPLLRALGTVILKRAGSSHGTSNIDRMIAAVLRGENLVVFPEGGITSEAGLKPFHSGVFVAAANAQVPIVVAGLRGARTALRLGTWLPRHSAIHLEIGPTLIPAGKDPSALLQLRTEAHRAMEPLSGESDATTHSCHRSVCAPTSEKHLPYRFPGTPVVAARNGKHLALRQDICQ
ncbi:MAG TPA: lysophospholipid acyltransferase family protein [Paucimonas sp.]|nr:lysophospholipid acyltransferase family protein [Paucimonas sp.]